MAEGGRRWPKARKMRQFVDWWSTANGLCVGLFLALSGFGGAAPPAPIQIQLLFQWFMYLYLSVVMCLLPNLPPSLVGKGALCVGFIFLQLDAVFFVDEGMRTQANIFLQWFSKPNSNLWVVLVRLFFAGFYVEWVRLAVWVATARRPATCPRLKRMARRGVDLLAWTYMIPQWFLLWQSGVFFRLYLWYKGGGAVLLLLNGCDEGSDGGRTIWRSETDRCSICLTDFTSMVLYELRCGHVFHKKCVREWFQHFRTCPICRERAGPLPRPPRVRFIPYLF